MWEGWALVAIVALVSAAVSNRAGRSWLTAPMVAVALGVLVSEKALDLVRIEVEGPVVTTLFEATLALLLFIEADIVAGTVAPLEIPKGPVLVPLEAPEPV